MNPTSLSDAALDAVLSDFFKGQMKKPWPAAPTVPNTGSEPSVLAATRAAQSGATDTPRNQPAATRDTSSRARYTLAASVAILLGTCWTLSNGFQAGERPGGGTVSQPDRDFDMKHGTADGKNTLPGALKKDAPEKGDDNKGFVPPKIDLP